MRYIFVYVLFTLNGQMPLKISIFSRLAGMYSFICLVCLQAQINIIISLVYYDIKVAYICIQLCICFDRALLSLRACMVYWGHSLSHYTKSYLVIQLEIKAVAIRIYNGHLYFLKSTTTSLISPIPHCSRCQQKVLLDQQVGWGK